MKHGFARTSLWSSDPVVEENGLAVCRLHFNATEETRKIWDYTFVLVYTIRLSATTLSTELSFLFLFRFNIELKILETNRLIVSASCIPTTLFLVLPTCRLKA